MSRLDRIASALQTTLWTTLEEVYDNMSGRITTKEKLRELLGIMVNDGVVVRAHDVGRRANGWRFPQAYALAPGPNASIPKPVCEGPERYKGTYRYLPKKKREHLAKTAIPTSIPELRKALEGKETTVEDLVRCVAPRLHQVSPVAKAAEGNGKQQRHGSRPAMAAVGYVLGQRTTRTTKIEEDHPVDRKTGLPNPRWKLEMAMVAWIRDADARLEKLSPLEVCWLARLAMACAFTYVVDEKDESKDMRAHELTPELEAAIGEYKLYDHGLCGGQRAAMWPHIFPEKSYDAAHVYEVEYCAARSFAETTDKEKLKTAHVYAPTERRAVLVDDRRVGESMTAWMQRVELKIRDLPGAVGEVHRLLKLDGSRLRAVANGSLASRGWTQVVVSEITARNTPDDVRRKRGSKPRGAQAAAAGSSMASYAAAACCDDDGDDATP